MGSRGLGGPAGRTVSFHQNPVETARIGEAPDRIGRETTKDLRLHETLFADWPKTPPAGQAFLPHLPQQQVRDPFGVLNLLPYPDHGVLWERGSEMAHS